MSSGMTISAEHKLQHKDNNALITNSTAETFIVYGPRRETDGGNYENSWYVLHSGETIPSDWQCDGLFIPKDRELVQMNGEIIQGPAAIKYGSLMHVTIAQDGSKYIEKDNHNEGVFHKTDIAWDVPDFDAEYCQNISMEKYQIS
ncbi:hypothetical protein [Clostridium saccharobutylicum]|uniref:Uncharacterized protein n=1 Tax=Clostridium saccharobutylicum DSM 13864 TaxID=1345695 RepID=U5MUN5_CLOSA|nr:hypothetical protein [Clostridium saccharobutylicum]AGX44248.1 hypothetical protein CLSA_c32840 [Clostridium saccharobutylicum DSM 13864]AQR91537.1 hypothetical protein CLOSC_32630 [Clostridium saccharobutylicum]AQS01442.1 hypothetical protein CSACC_32710 [Clostridium saccharobutylicum]AQS11051.1 hypothetical protein CLOBY_32010 [Clostridium saccharobutylicum]AQS15425.1 hypothetical protein CLOSACC_32710 [Clostridium saccharobutylicum]